MLKKQTEEDGEIIQTLELTSKLEKSLRKLMSSRKYTSYQKTQEKGYQHSTIAALERELKKLKEENKELFIDNQQVCRDVIRLRDQNRQLKKQASENKKYIEHLQNYNSELKKQLLFWMRKPKKSSQSCQKEESVGELMTEVLKLRRQNEDRQHQLQTLRGKTISVTEIKLPDPPKKKNLHIQELSKLKKKQQYPINSCKMGQKHNKSTNECTSCNYKQYSKSKNKKLLLKKSQSTTQRPKISKNLCECHRQYLQSSKFQP